MGHPISTIYLLVLGFTLITCTIQETPSTELKFSQVLAKVGQSIPHTRRVYLVNFTAKCNGCVQDIANYYIKNHQNQSLAYIICPQSLRDLKVEYPYPVRTNSNFLVDSASVALSINLVTDKPAIFFCENQRLIAHWELEFRNRDSTFKAINEYIGKK
jgi:hypothetical protein